jgi:hypothetical protein
MRPVPAHSRDLLKRPPVAVEHGLLAADLGDLLQRIGAHALRDGTSPAAIAVITEW